CVFHVFYFLAGAKFMIIAPYCFYVQRCRTSYLNPRSITRRLSGIHAAWHFWYAVIFVVKVVCGRLVYAALTP
ncbi:DUF3265 domain-containing protein, partial [Vibrio vulnificus]|uniref:hypothetical protein n=1 Tax=Vibrio vulnificus TaxID=672 RepID=UPI0024DFCCC3